VSAYETPKLAGRDENGFTAEIARQAQHYDQHGDRDYGAKNAQRRARRARARDMEAAGVSLRVDVYERARAYLQAPAWLSGNVLAGRIRRGCDRRRARKAAALLGEPVPAWARPRA
jgi:hypothetical protein